MKHKKHIKDASFFPLSLYEVGQLNQLCAAARRLDARGAIPATSSNFSMRTKDKYFLISKSGLHKKNLNASHFVRTDLFGVPLHSLSPRPSDETLLHAVIYRNISTAQVVLHCHAPELEVVNLPKNELSGFYKIEGHELLKILGYKTHHEEFLLPVFKNSQDMHFLAQEVERFMLSAGSSFFAFVLEHHGIYCFGNSISQCENRLEAFLYLIKNK